MKTEKTLEILIDGDLKETVSLLVGSPIEVIGINCKNGKAVKSQLLGEKQRYSFDFEDYKKIVRNSLERLYPGKNIELREYQK